MICSKSEFFSKAFNGGFKEALENSIYLEEDEADTVDCFIVWLYSNNLPAYPSTRFPERDSSAHEVVNLLVDCFCFAEAKFCTNEFKNGIMDRIQDTEYKHWWGRSESGIAGIYEKTYEKSKLRCYLAVTAAWTLSQYDCNPEERAMYAKLCSDLPDFAMDLLEVQHTYRAKSYLDPYGRFGRVKEWEDFETCSFHTHAEGEKC